MRLYRLFSNLRLGVKAAITAILAFMMLEIIVGSAGTVALRQLIAQIGRNRAEQEMAVIQNRFAQAEEDILASTKLLAGRQGLVEAVADQNTTAIETHVLVGAAPLDIDEIAVAGPDGAYIVTAPGEGATLYAAQQASLTSLALLGIESTGAIIDEDKTALWLAVSVPLRDRSGNIVGTLMASRRVDDAFLGEINFSRQDIHLALVAEGRVLAHSFSSPELLEELSTAVLDENTIRQTLSGQTSVADRLLNGADGTPYALAHIPLVVHNDPVAAISIIVDLAQTNVFRRQLTTNMAIAFTVLALVALFGVSVVVRQGITKSIGKLTSVAQQMAAGDYAQRAEVATRDEVGQLGQAFNEMAAELQQTLESLERRVADRTRALETSTQVSHRLSTILDREQLVAEVVKQVQEAFNYYHVHIYLLDEATQDLVMAGGTGAAGRAMLADGHRISQGRGLVGRAATTNTTVLVSDVRQDANWLPNPLLPDTRAEIAVPISTGERLLGVLDVQHNVTNGLSNDDADLLASIAGQVAVALQNTRLFAEAQKRARFEERVNLISQRIQNTTTVEEALQISVRELGRILKAETSVHLGAAAESGSDRDEPVFVTHDQTEASS